MASLLSDIRFAVRQVRRDPKFSLLVVGALGLGIGATTVIFSVFNAVVLRPLPFPQPQQLVRVRETTPQGQLFSISEPNFLDLHQSSRSFSHFVAVVLRPMTLVGDGEPERVTGTGTTAGLLAMLGTAPYLGVTFSPADFEVGNAAPFALISHAIWERQFGSDPEMIGRTVKVDGVSRVVVGVMPAGIRFPFAADVLIPISPDPTSQRAEHRLEALGRLKPGVTVEQARAELDGIAARLGSEYPQSNSGWGVSVVTFREWLIGPSAKRVALVLLGSVGLLLLLGSAGVSNLLLARATTRKPEIALRASLGAANSRILSQLIVESLVLSGLGACLGLLLVAWALPFIQNLGTSALPRLNEVTIDPTVLAFAVLVTAVTGLLCGIAPALEASRGELSEIAKQSGQILAVRTRGVRDALVTAQIALAVVPLVGAGLLTNSFLRLLHVDPGFNAEGVLAAELSLPAESYPELSRETAMFYHDILQQLEAVPGVTAAGASTVSPLSAVRAADFVGVAGEVVEQNDLVAVQWRAVTPGFFDALGVRLVAGRFLYEGDSNTAGPSRAQNAGGADASVVINESLASLLWLGRDPVSKQIAWSTPDGPLMNVVGVISDIRDVTYAENPVPTVFLPYGLAPLPTMTLLVRTSGDPASMAGALRKAIWSLDPSVPVPLIVPLLQALEDTALSGPRLHVFLLTLFASAALGLAALGTYGITAYTVAQRAREIGVRMALGAGPDQLVSLMLGRGMRIIMAGTALGLLGAVAMSRLMTSMLYEIRTTDPATYAVVIFILTSVALLANYVPARRATRVDPRMAAVSEP
jgi:predicted permease